MVAAELAGLMLNKRKEEDLRENSTARFSQEIEAKNAQKENDHWNVI